MSTGCSPTGFSIPGSVLHTGLAELRAALPGGALARFCAVGRLEGWAGEDEHRDGIIHTLCHRLCDKHMPTSTEKHSYVCRAHSLLRYSRRECMPETCFALPWASVACFLAFSELRKGGRKRHDICNFHWWDIIGLPLASLNGSVIVMEHQCWILVLFFRFS